MSKRRTGAVIDTSRRKAARPVRRLATGHRVLMLATLVGAGLVAFGNSLWGAFIFDDQTAILANPHIRTLWPPIVPLTSPNDTALAGRPLVSLSLAVNYHAGGFNPFGYHVFNLAVHLACGLLVFGVVRETLDRPRLGLLLAGHSDDLAFLCALLWIVHPLQTEAVNYITQRTESMAGFFYLATLFGAIRSVESQRRRRHWMVVAISASALGMMCKETVATAPLAVLLWLWIFEDQPIGRLLFQNRVLLSGLAATWLVVAAMLVLGTRSGTAGFSTPVGGLMYLANQGPLILRYLRLSFWPTDLVLDYGTPSAVPAGTVAATMALVGVLLVGSLAAVASRTVLGYPAALFFLLLAPSSSFVPIASEVGAERRMYLALGAVISFVVVGAAASIPRAVGKANGVSLRSAAARWTVSLTAVALAIPLIVLSRNRNLHYRDPVVLWQSSVDRRPTWRAYNNLGSALLQRGDRFGASARFREALRLEPEALEARFNLALNQCTLGQLKECELQFREYIRRNPRNPVAFNLLGVALSKEGRDQDAVNAFTEAVRLDPAFAEAHANLGSLLLASGDSVRAAGHFKRFLDAHTESAPVHVALGIALAREDNLTEAITEFQAAVRIQPTSAEARLNLGKALTQAGARDEARKQLREAVRLNPELGSEAAGILDDGSRR